MILLPHPTGSPSPARARQCLATRPISTRVYALHCEFSHAPLPACDLAHLDRILGWRLERALADTEFIDRFQRSTRVAIEHFVREPGLTREHRVVKALWSHVWEDTTLCAASLLAGFPALTAPEARRLADILTPWELRSTCYKASTLSPAFLDAVLRSNQADLVAACFILSTLHPSVPTTIGAQVLTRQIEDAATRGLPDPDAWLPAFCANDRRWSEVLLDALIAAGPTLKGSVPRAVAEAAVTRARQAGMPISIPLAQRLTLAGQRELAEQGCAMIVELMPCP